MKPDQIAAVQQSFDRVFPIKHALAETFYAPRLFEIAPEVQIARCFPHDMAEQRQKLSDTLAYVVPNLHRPEVIEETILGLARRQLCAMALCPRISGRLAWRWCMRSRRICRGRRR